MSLQKTVFLGIILSFFSIAVVQAESTKELQREMDEIKRVQELNAGVMAEARQEIASLRAEIQTLRGLIEETTFFFKQESQKNEKNLRDFDFRLTGIEERLSLHQKQLEELFSKDSVKISKKPQEKEAEKTYAKEEEEAAYKRGLAEINLGNYLQSLALFDEFLKKYPNSSLAANAQYWKGEALYATRDFSAALVEFDKVIKQFPKSDKAAGALLKQGYCLFEQKLYPDARIFLNKVVQDFPKSDEAAEAKERLKKIEGMTVPVAP